MQIPFNDTKRLFLRHKDEILSAFSEVAESGWWLMGKANKEFSEAFSSYCGVDYCIPVANGTDALELAVKSVLSDENLNGDTEVITVANAGGYSSVACFSAGVTPIYADVDSRNCLISIRSLEKLLNPRVKAIIVTHLFGGVVNVKKIRELLNSNGYLDVKIIEDCAQAHGAFLAEERIGSLGDVAAFSFYPTKNLGAMGDGGALLTSDPNLYERISMLSQYGWDKKYSIKIRGGRNSRMDELQAAILNRALYFLDSYNEKRKSIYTEYAAIKNENIIFLDHRNNDYVAHLAVVKVDDRNNFISYMKNLGISVDVHYPILDVDQEAWKDYKYYHPHSNNLPVSRELVNKIVSLPCFPTMNDDEVKYVSKALKEWMG